MLSSPSTLTPPCCSLIPWSRPEEPQHGLYAAAASVKGAACGRRRTPVQLSFSQAPPSSLRGPVGRTSYPPSGLRPCSAHERNEIRTG
eukprot:6902291-Alexandrium_andersonii.AAC.1